MGWAGFAGIFAAFFVTHSIPIRPAIKGRITARIGTRGFTAAYSVLSLGMLSLLIWAAREAPYVLLWPQMPFQRHLVHVGMFAVCVILALSIGRPNPFSFGGVHNDRFDPSHPGIVRWVRHPVLAALALWAGLHILPNGDLAHVLLFGVLGAFALAGRWLIDLRKRRELGEGAWQELWAEVKEAPGVARPRSWREFFLRLTFAFAAYATLLWAHPFVIGVSAL